MIFMYSSTEVVDGLLAPTDTGLWVRHCCRYVPLDNVVTKDTGAFVVGVNVATFLSRDLEPPIHHYDETFRNTVRDPQCFNQYTSSPYEYAARQGSEYDSTV
jgi:hypothetical protein